MLKIVVGEKGKGKTKILLDSANEFAKSSNGLAVYLDKNNKHMFELDKQVRLIDMSDYCQFGGKHLEGFICGIIAGNHDIEAVYVDGFLTLSDYEINGDLTPALDDISRTCAETNVDIILSISSAPDRIPEKFKANIIASL